MSSPIDVENSHSIPLCIGRRDRRGPPPCRNKVERSPGPPRTVPRGEWEGEGRRNRDPTFRLNSLHQGALDSYSERCFHHEL